MTIDYSKGFRQAADSAKDLESAGIDVIFVAEAYGFDGVSQLGYIAAKTERAEIASGILPIYTRTPSLLAQTAAGLDALSGGRFVLGLGASGPQVIEGWHGIPYDKPLERTKEIIEICREAWTREPLKHKGLYEIPLPEGKGTGLGKSLKMINHPERKSVPVWIASLGPRNVAMTAEIANGWLPTLYMPEGAHKVWGKALEEGKAARSKDLPPLDVAAGGALAIGDGYEDLIDMGRPTAALYIGGMGARGKNFYNNVVRRYGYEAEAERIQDLYLDGKKKEAAAEVPKELLVKTNLVGSESHVKERIAAFKESGVTVLQVTPMGPDPLGDIAKVKEWVS